MDTSPHASQADNGCSLYAVPKLGDWRNIHKEDYNTCSVVILNKTGKKMVDWNVVVLNKTEKKMVDSDDEENCGNSNKRRVAKCKLIETFRDWWARCTSIVCTFAFIEQSFQSSF